MTASHHHEHYSKSQERQYEWLKKHYPFGHAGGDEAQKKKDEHKHKHYSEAQQRQYDWLRKHYPFGHSGGGSAGSAGKKDAARKKKRSAAGTAAGSGWITAGNEELPDCVAVAVANTLLAATGVRAADSDVIRLHHLADTGGGASIGGVLDALAAHGLGGLRPAGFWPCAGELCGLPLIAGLTDGVNDHAAARTAAGLISWGGLLRPGTAWTPDGEYWAIAWP